MLLYTTAGTSISISSKVRSSLNLWHLILTISSSRPAWFFLIIFLATLGVRPVLTLKTGELPVETLAELRAGELTAEPVAIMLEERARVELERLSELDVSLVVELNVELLLCKLTELMLPLRLWFDMSSRCW